MFGCWAGRRMERKTFLYTSIAVISSIVLDAALLVFCIIVQEAPSLRAISLQRYTSVLVYILLFSLVFVVKCVVVLFSACAQRMADTFFEDSPAYLLHSSASALQYRRKAFPNVAPRRQVGSPHSIGSQASLSHALSRQKSF